MKIFLVLIFFLFFKKCYFLNILRRKHYYFIKKNNFRPKKKYGCQEVKCKLEGIEYKVRDLSDSINFYRNVFNFKISEKEKNFVKFILGDDQAYIKLIQKGEENMSIGEHSFLGLGIQLEDFEINKTKLYKGNIEEEIEKRPITPCILPDEDAQIRKYWKNCFVTDPDGYGIEVVLENQETKLDRIRFYTTSTKDCQKFYSDILGMDLVKIQSHLEEISYPWNIYGGMSYFFSSKQNSTLLQFAYGYDEDKLHMGNSLGNIVISFNDLNKVEKKLIENDIKILKNGDDILVKDLDGYNVYLRKNK